MSSLAVPIGTIVAYCGDRENLKGSNWGICDGTRYSVTEFPDLHAAIGDVNGVATNSQFQIPDLRGFFLRGRGVVELADRLDPTFIFRSTEGWQEAGFCSSDCKIAAPRGNQFELKLDMAGAKDQYHDVSKGSNQQMMDVTESAPDIIVTSDKETRPMNMYMDYIIKLKEASSGQKANLPAGSVFPFSGPENTFPVGDNPNQFVLCDGTLVPAEDCKDLQKTVGGRFKNHTSTDNTKFQPPDLKNYFIRGISDSFFPHDPDYSNRERAPDGATRGRGTTQDWATRFVDSKFRIPCLQTNTAATSGCSKAAGWGGIAPGKWKQDFDFTGGDEETRPVNVAVQFVLNAVEPAADKATNLPIGGIIGIPGKPNLAQDGSAFGGQYLLCDGKEHESQNFPDLSALYGGQQGIWRNERGTSSTGFCTPDLRGQFLRGADPGERQVASRQGFATGKPKTLKVNVPLYPTESFSVAATVPLWNNKIYDEGSAHQKWSLLADWSSETAPVWVTVCFYVRAK